MDKTAVRLVSSFKTIDEFLFCAMFFVLPFGWSFSIIPLILFFVTQLISILRFRTPLDKGAAAFYFPMFLFWGWSAISLIWSEKAGYGVELLMKQITLILFPLLFLFSRFDFELLKKAVLFFVIGILLSAIVIVLSSLSNCIIPQNGEIIISFIDENITKQILDSDVYQFKMLGASLSMFMHPTYFGIMVATAMLLLINSTTNNSEFQFSYKWITFALFFLSIVLVMLSVNALIIIALFILVFSLIIVLFQWNQTGIIANLSAILLIISTIIVFVSPQFLLFLNPELPISMQMRSDIWHASWIAITNRFAAGVGAGAEINYLTQIYNDLGMDQFAQSRYNPHNQFLQTWLASGIIGLLSLVWMFANLIILAVKSKNNLPWGFAVIMLISFMFESVLQRYWGITFFAIFYTLMFHYVKGEVLPKDKYYISD